LKQIETATFSNVIATRANVEDAKPSLVKKHSKPPKATQNANILKIGATLHIQANLAKKGVGTKSSSKL
jgi:hypothetical protein